MSWGVAPPEHRLPERARPVTVRLQVADLQRSLDYYQSMVGLELLRTSGPDAMLGAPESTRPIVELHERRGAAAAPRHRRFGLYHFAILLPDRGSLGAFVAHLERTGEPAASADHAVSEAIYLWDPDGLGIEVYADRPRSAWQANGRELHMTTEPLDIAGLLGSAGATPFAHVPPGTTLGHVHLHVENLKEAERFYHRALGFDKTVWSYPGALFLSAGGYHHHLATNTWTAHGSQPAEDEARLLEWELLLPDAADVSAARDSLHASGYETAGDAGAFQAADPSGTRVRITASP